MADKVKLRNPNKFDVGVKLIDPQRELNIKAGSFIMATRDDIYYLDTVSRLLKKSYLVVDDEEINVNLGYNGNNFNIINEKEIEELLFGNYLHMEKEIKKYTEPHVIDAIYQFAKTNVDKLSGSKIKFLSKFCGKDIPIEIEN